MSNRTLFPIMLGNGGPQGNYAVALNMNMDSNYVISAQLIDQNGNALGTEQTIDLPLESVVVNGSYDSQTESIILTLDNGNTITIPVSGLISGLRQVIDINDMTQAELLDFYTNYATRLTENTYVVGGYSFTTLTVTDPQYGNILVLESNKQFKDQAAGATAGTINVSVTITYIFANGTKSSTTGTYTVPLASQFATETLTFIDSNNVSTNVVVWTQPQI